MGVFFDKPTSCLNKSLLLSNAKKHRIRDNPMNLNGISMIYRHFPLIYHMFPVIYHHLPLIYRYFSSDLSSCFNDLSLISSYVSSLSSDVSSCSSYFIITFRVSDLS